MQCMMKALVERIRKGAGNKKKRRKRGEQKSLSFHCHVLRSPADPISCSMPPFPMLRGAEIYFLSGSLKLITKHSVFFLASN